MVYVATSEVGITGPVVRAKHRILRGTIDEGVTAVRSGIVDNSILTIALGNV